MNEERMIEIETKIAYQEKTIRDLNDVVYEHQREIEKLSSTCELLVKRVKELSDFSPGMDAPANEKPPHY